MASKMKTRQRRHISKGMKKTRGKRTRSMKRGGQPPRGCGPFQKWDSDKKYCVPNGCTSTQYYNGQTCKQCPNGTTSQGTWCN